MTARGAAPTLAAGTRMIDPAGLPAGTVTFLVLPCLKTVLKIPTVEDRIVPTSSSEYRIEPTTITAFSPTNHAFAPPAGLRS